MVAFRRRKGWKRLLHAILSDRLFLSLNHLRKVGRWPRLGRPRTFNEHILRRAVVERPDLRRHIDKGRARDLVAATLGPEFVPARFWLGDSHQLPWGELPDRCIISATHGSGMTMVINDMTSLDQRTAETILEDWLALDYPEFSSEPIYAGIPPRILVEENLSDGNGEPPSDYKFYCFHGTPRFVHVDLHRFSDLRRVVYDMDWQHAPFGKTLPNARIDLPKPPQFAKMVSLAAKAARGFPFVRVDLFAVGQERVVFGEWTFLPASGCGPFIPAAFDRQLGDLIAGGGGQGA